MIKSTKKAFTLVELIVVITILAILGTIAFISLSGYSAEARDSRRITNISNLTDKINIELIRGDLTARDLVDSTGSTTVDNTPITDVNGVKDGFRGAANFKNLRENGENFKDPKAKKDNQDYPLAIAIGGSGSGAYQFLQMAASMEAKNEARVRGNYNKESIEWSNPDGLIKSTSEGATWAVTDGGKTLPYDLN